MVVNSLMLPKPFSIKINNSSLFVRPRCAIKYGATV